MGYIKGHSTWGVEEYLDIQRYIHTLSPPHSLIVSDLFNGYPVNQALSRNNLKHINGSRYMDDLLSRMLTFLNGGKPDENGEYRSEW